MCNIYNKIKMKQNMQKQTMLQTLPKTKQKKQKSFENLKQQKQVLLDREGGEKRRKRCFEYGFLVTKLDKRFVHTKYQATIV